MYVEILPVPDGSRAIRIFPEGSDRVDGYVLSALLIHIDDKTAELALAHGDMSHESNLAMGAEVLKLGYQFLIFKARPGIRVTRWAEKVNTGDKHDHYIVDLHKAAAEVLGEDYES
jgi:hypothetical protein